MAGEIVSVLFTDLVGSTSLADRLGDAEAETVRRTHFGLLRDAISGYRGQEVKNLGDGLMVVFASAVDAVDAAIAIQRTLADHNAAASGTPIHVRVGVHVGEPIRAEGDYFGTVVNIAARLCGAAASGQVLVSSLIEEVAGPRGGVEFCSVGELELKGISGRCPRPQCGGPRMRRSRGRSPRWCRDTRTSASRCPRPASWGGTRCWTPLWWRSSTPAS